VNTTVITVVLLQNCIDLRSGERNEVIRVQLEGVSDVVEEENGEPTTSPLTDPRVGFKAVECLACFIDIQNWLSVSVCPAETVV
jgi:hypothetical protein